MSYSFDKISDRWAELSDTYSSYLDELETAKDTTEMYDVFVDVADFDEYEVL